MVGVRVALWLREPVMVPVLLALSVALCEGRADEVGAAETEAAAERVADAVALGVAEAEADSEAAPECETESDEVAELEAAPECVTWRVVMVAEVGQEEGGTRGE